MSQHDNSSSDFEDDSELLRNAVDEDSQQDEELLEDEPEIPQAKDVEQSEEEPEEEEGSCEMLDLLCDQVEVEEYKEEKQRELEQMKKIMDDRQQRRELIKEKKEA